MRIRRLLRVAGYITASRAGSSRHALRHRVAPDEWTRSDPYRIRWVPPSAVTSTTARRISEGERGRMLDGDWDVTALPLQGLAVWRGLEQRLCEGLAWEDTVLAPGRQHVPEAPNVGRRYADLPTVVIAKRLAGLDALATTLRRDGWLPHHDIGAPFRKEMAVVISRDGRLIRNSSGLHRLIMAHLLGLDRIPCRVLVEHAEYIDVGIR